MISCILVAGLKGVWTDFAGASGAGAVEVLAASGAFSFDCETVSGLLEAGFEVDVAGPEARLYHTVLHEIPPDSSIPWDITQERPGYFIQATVAFADAKASPGGARLAHLGKK